jgi:hypothetical protein
MINRDILLSLDDSALLGECDVRHVRGTGPGGQKKNKTSSAIMLTHRPTGIAVRAQDSRSQSQNIRAALQRLRWRIAQTVRAAPVVLPAPFSPRKPSDAARLIDHLDAHAYSLRDTAVVLHVTSSQLSGWIQQSDELFIQVNTMRKLLHLRVLQR